MSVLIVSTTTMSAAGRSRGQTELRNLGIWELPQKPKQLPEQKQQPLLAPTRQPQPTQHITPQHTSTPAQPVATGTATQTVRPRYTSATTHTEPITLKNITPPKFSFFSPIKSRRAMHYYKAATAPGGYLEKAHNFDYAQQPGGKYSFKQTQNQLRRAQERFDAEKTGDKKLVEKVLARHKIEIEAEAAAKAAKAAAKPPVIEPQPTHTQQTPQTVQQPAQTPQPVTTLTIAPPPATNRRAMKYYEEATGPDGYLNDRDLAGKVMMLKMAAQHEKDGNFETAQQFRTWAEPTVRRAQERFDAEMTGDKKVVAATLARHKAEQEAQALKEMAASTTKQTPQTPATTTQTAPVRPERVEAPAPVLAPIPPAPLVQQPVVPPTPARPERVERPATTQSLPSIQQSGPKRSQVTSAVYE